MFKLEQSSHSVCRYNRQGRKANVGAGTATATEPVYNLHTRREIQAPELLWYTMLFINSSAKRVPDTPAALVVLLVRPLC